MEASTWPSLTVAGAFPLPDHGLCANLKAVFGDYVTLQTPIDAPPVENESETVVHNIDHLVFACLLYWKNAFLYSTSNLVVAIRWKKTVSYTFRNLAEFNLYKYFESHT